MTKAELAEKIANQTGLTKKASIGAVDAVFASIREAMKSGKKVSLVGFGTFDVRKRAAREGRNPRTGKAVKIAARQIAVFKAGKGLRDALAK